MAISQPLMDADIERQIALVRYAEGQYKTILPVLRGIADNLRGKILAEGDKIPSKKRLNALLVDVENLMGAEFDDWGNEVLSPALVDTAETEVDFNTKTVGAVVSDYETTVPALAQVISAARNNPIETGANNGSVDFAKYTKTWKQSSIAKVTQVINTGFYSGQNTTEIAKAVSGTKSLKYKDGLMGTKVRADIRGMTHTSIMHMSAIGKSEFGKQNKDLIIGMRDVITLDSFTSSKCKWRGKEPYLFADYGQNYPRPPYHINCRTTQTYELGDEYSFLRERRTRPAVTQNKDGKTVAEQVPVTQPLFTWLKNQPAPVQADSLGVTKAKIFRNAGLSPDEFEKAFYDQLHNELTIDEMAQKNSKIAEYLRKMNS